MGDQGWGQHQKLPQRESSVSVDPGTGIIWDMAPLSLLSEADD